MSPSEAIVSRESEGPVSVSISPRGVLLLPPPAYPGKAVATVEPELSSRPPSLSNRLCPLWPLPPDLGLLNHQGWSSQTVPFWSSPMQRLHLKPFFLLSHRCPRNGGPRQVSDLFPGGCRSSGPFRGRFNATSSSSVKSSKSIFRSSALEWPSLNLWSLYITLSILLLSPIRTPNRSVSF